MHKQSSVRWILCALFLAFNLMLPNLVTAAKTYGVILDECDKEIESHFNAMGGSRGIVWEGQAVYSHKENTCRAQITAGPAAGMSYSLIHSTGDAQPLDFRQIFGPLIKSKYQGRVVGLEMVIRNIVSPSKNQNLQLRIEFKDTEGRWIKPPTVYPGKNLYSKTFPLRFSFDIDPVEYKKVNEIVWVLDNANQGDSISIDRILLKVEVPDLPTREQAFLWSYSWLAANYDPTKGMVQDKSREEFGTNENVSATAKFAKITYYAFLKGYVTQDKANQVITKISDTLLKLVPGPEGKNALWPHFTVFDPVKKKRIPKPPDPGNPEDKGTEWSSGDSLYAALDMMTTLQMMGGQWAQLKGFEQFIRGIKWKDLLVKEAGGKRYLSHGYEYDGTKKTNSWTGFGMETIGVNWAYAAATSGRTTSMDPPPTDNGSGFIENAQYPMVLNVKDRWGNDWKTLRSEMADRQINWYCQEHINQFLCNESMGMPLFGLSAAEKPDGKGYPAYGVGGKGHDKAPFPPEDGEGTVIVLHYSGMIADIRPEAAQNMWECLRDRKPAFLKKSKTVLLSPLNNVESMSVNAEDGTIEVNRMKGSWNLALQAEGWAMADPKVRRALKKAVQEENSFLKKGYSSLISSQ